MYDGLLTLSKYLFLIVCWVALLDKKPVHSVYLVYAPTIPQTLARSDELSGLNRLFQSERTQYAFKNEAKLNLCLFLVS